MKVNSKLGLRAWIPKTTCDLDFRSRHPKTESISLLVPRVLGFGAWNKKSILFGGTFASPIQPYGWTLRCKSQVELRVRHRTSYHIQSYGWLWRLVCLTQCNLYVCTSYLHFKSNLKVTHMAPANLHLTVLRFLVPSWHPFFGSYSRSRGYNERMS